MDLTMVLVKWEDAYSDGEAGWVNLAEIKAPEKAYITSVGWLVYEDEFTVIIAQNHNAGFEQAADYMNIPRANIIGISELKVTRFMWSPSQLAPT